MLTWKISVSDLPRPSDVAPLYEHMQSAVLIGTVSLIGAE